MTKAEKRVMVTAENVLAKMMPGERHSLRDIALRVGGGIASVRMVLAECVARRAVRMESTGKRQVYLLVTAKNAGKDARAPVGPHMILQGYDATNRRFAELCMAARSPVSQDQNVRYGVIGATSG